MRFKKERDQLLYEINSIDCDLSLNIAEALEFNPDTALLGTPSISLLGIFNITDAKNSANGILVTLFIIILDQIASSIIRVTKEFTVTVISDLTFLFLDGLPDVNKTFYVYA